MPAPELRRGGAHRPHDRTPFGDVPEVASFTLSSEDVSDGERLSLDQVSGVFGAGGTDTSPQLKWSGFPDGTRRKLRHRDPL